MEFSIIHSHKGERQIFLLPAAADLLLGAKNGTDRACIMAGPSDNHLHVIDILLSRKNLVRQPQLDCVIDEKLERGEIGGWAVLMP